MPSLREPAAAQLNRRDMLRLIAACLPTALCGCGYMVGNPHPMGVRTIHIPTFTSDSFRRDFELQLTEAVQKQVMQRTNFQIVPANEAESQLTGRIRNISKRPTNQNRYDDPRELELNLAVEVSWEHFATGEVLHQATIPVDAHTTRLVANASFAPETGQSLATARQTAIDDLARQIVSMMEPAW